MLGPTPQPQQRERRNPNFLDKILGLYGADPSTHIPEGQRGQVLQQGLRQAGIATAMAGGRGHDSLTPGQAIATFMGTMQQAGPRYAAEQKKAQINAMLESGHMNPQQLQAAMQQLIAAGDYEGARMMSEVLKTQLAAGEDRYIKSKDPIYDTLTGTWIYPDGQLAEPTEWRTQQHPTTGRQVDVPYYGNTPDWSAAVPKGESDSSIRGRYNRNVLSLTDRYEKAIGKIEPSYRLTNAALSQADAARGGEMGAQLSMLYGFIRALDPNSVVREGEVRLAQEAAPLRERAIQWYNSIIRNRSPILTEKMVNELESTMQTLKADNESWMQGRREHYGGTLAEELLGKQRLDLFIDPFEMLGAGGGNPLAEAGKAEMVFDPADYETLAAKKWETEEGQEEMRREIREALEG
jgi:hypothetical protein